MAAKRHYDNSFSDLLTSDSMSTEFHQQYRIRDEPKNTYCKIDHIKGDPDIVVGL